MKKQVIFASVAVLVAIAGVFANTMPVTYKYYRSNVALDPTINCAVVITDQCAEGTQVHCSQQYSTGPGQTATFFLFKRETNAQGEPIGACEVLKRPNL